jgi:hypothetical protein
MAEDDKAAQLRAYRRAYSAKWLKQNPDYHRRWHEERPDYQREWRSASPNRLAAYNAKRRAEYAAAKQHRPQ